MKAEEMKERLRQALPLWIDTRIESLVQGPQRLNPVTGNYVKKFLTNWTGKHMGDIDKTVDSLFLVAGENGEISASTLFKDIVTVMRDSKESVLLDTPAMRIKAGGGTILRMETSNPVVSFLMGNTTALKVTEEDIEELRSLVCG